MSFGLLNSDCRWVFDEVQLMGPARATSAQLDGLRAQFGTLHVCETLWASATVDRGALETVDRSQLGRVLTVPAEDRTGVLATRLNASKVLQRVDLSGERGGRLPAAIARAVADGHVRGQRTLVVLNTVGRAQAVARELGRWAGEGGPWVVLVHSRFRPTDRMARLAEALAEVDSDGPGTIVVATQVVEAGVDMSSRTSRARARASRRDPPRNHRGSEGETSMFPVPQPDRLPVPARSDRFSSRLSPRLGRSASVLA